MSAEAAQPRSGWIPDGTVVYAIGDIHGRLDLLTELHARIAADAVQRHASRRLVVYLGDLVSRGPNSRGVVDRVLSWLPPGFERVALKGNHEDLLLRTRDGDEVAARHWLDYGGVAALSSYGLAIDPGHPRDPSAMADLCQRFRAVLPGEHSRFLGSLPTSFRCGGYFFAHGGVRPGIPLELQTPRDLLWIRKAFLNSRADHGAVVVHGHCVCREPELLDNRIGIDTGAYASGVLTCVVLEATDRRLLQATTFNPQ